MKKIFLTLMLLCAVSFAGFAQSKFYINPGHGGHDSDDRPIDLPLGVERFYESDGSLDRGFSLRDFFNGLGCETKMSRTTNYSSDDLDLNLIAAYSNSFGGYFISLHTNGFNASTNYTIAIYKGSSPSYPTIYEPAPTMAQTVANWLYNNYLTDQTFSTPRAFADYSYYKDSAGNPYHLGVLRTNTRPGYLVESWFHDYRPEALRMKSTLYNKYLAWQICRASFDSPGGIPKNLKGCIVGDIRNVSQGCGYSEYTSRNRDSKLAINGATVKLLNASGNEVASCNTDNCCNGVYGFFDIDAGNYTLVVSKSGYKTQRIGVSVSDMASTLRNIDLEEGNSDGIYANVSSLDFGFVYSGSRPQKEIKIEGYGLPSNISVSSTDNTNFSLSTNSLSANGGTVTVTYNAASVGSHNAVITFSSGSYTVKVNVKGSADETPLKNITDKWNYSEANGNSTALGFDTKKINNFCYANGKLYCVYDHSRIIVLNAQTAEVLGDLLLGTTVTGGTYTLSDVSYVDGKIVACNMVKSGQELRLYSWDTDSSAPQVLLHTTDLCGAAELGYCMEFNKDASFTGTLRAGFIYDSGTETKIIEYDRNSSGTWSTKTAQMTNADGSEYYHVGKYARLYPWTANDYWVDGCESLPTYVTAVSNTSNSKYGEYCTVGVPGNWGSSHREFYWNGQKYAANIIFDGKKNGRLSVTQDNTGNYSSITLTGSFPAKGLGSSENTTGAGDVYINTDGSTYFEAWVFSENQGFAYLTYGNVPQNQNVYGPFKLKEKWNYSIANDSELNAGYDATLINNFCYANGKLYCVYDHSKVIVLNARTGALLGSLKMSPIVAGGTYTLSDVSYVDGRIVACNFVKAGQALRFYCWSSDTALPELLLNTTDLQGAQELGAAMEFDRTPSFSGDAWAGFVEDNGSETKLIEYCRKSDGSWTAKHVYLTDANGNYRSAGKLARVYPWGGTYWIDGSGTYPTYINSIDNTNTKYSEACHVKVPSAWGASHHEFTWASQKYAIDIVFDGKKNGRMYLLQDNAGNYSTITPMGSYPENGLGDVENTSGAGDIAINTDGKNYFEGWVFSENQGIAYYSYGTVPQDNPQSLTGANPYAYGLSSYPEGYNLVATYSLNADAENVDFIFYDKNGKQVHTESLGARFAGQHTDYVDVTALPEDDGYSWAISVKGASKSSAQEFMSLKFYYPRSIDVNNNMESESFGNVYCTEGAEVPSTGYFTSSDGQGLYAFKPDFTPIQNPSTGKYAFMGGFTPSNNANGNFGSDLQKVRVSNDGRIFVTRGNDSGSYIAYAPSFEDLVENNHFESLLRGGSNDASSLMYRDGGGNFLAAANLSMDIKGEGDNLKLLALSYQSALFTTFNPTYARVDEYSLGNSDALSSPRTISGLSGKYTIYPDGANIAYDNRGGVWYCQYRSQPTESTPSLVYIDANGNERLKETTVVRGGAGVRLSPDCSKIAIASSTTEFTVYNLTYSSDGTPSLSSAYTISHGMGSNVNDIAWDIANNVYVCGKMDRYFKAFALPFNTPTVTKAKDIYNFTKLSTGVDRITEDETSGDAVTEYYNLLGIKVSADNLRPGIYIRKIGNKTDKILVK